jgi:Flp pilus assembly pilin Flp
MKNLFARFINDESGQDMVEYVLILGFVCIAAAAIMTGVGTDVKDIWTKTSGHLAAADAAAPAAAAAS